MRYRNNNNAFYEFKGEVEYFMGATLNIEKKTLLHYVIMIAIIIAGYLIPPFSVVTAYGVKLLCVFVALVYGWTFIGMLTPSLIGCFGIALAGYGTMENVFLGLFNNINILLMIIGALAFDALRQTNAVDWMFGTVLTSGFAKKSPLLTVGCIFAVALLLGGLGMGIVLQFVLFPIMGQFLVKCGYRKGDKFCTMFLLGFIMACVLPISVFPFYSWGLVICRSIASIIGYVVPIGWWFLLNFILFAAFLIFYPLMMKVFGCDFSKLQNVDVVEAFNFTKGMKMDGAQKLALGGMILFIVLVLVGSFAPIPALKAVYGKILVTGLMVLYWAIMLIVQYDGKPILDMKQAANMLRWDLLILMATALVLSPALTSEESGIGTWIAMMISPLLATAGEVSMVIIIAALMIILTNLANNIAIVFIFINIIASLCLNGMSVNLLAISFILAIGSCAVAYLTPASSMQGALVHGASMVDTKDVMKYNMVMMVWLFVMMLVICVPVTLLGIGM